MMLHYTQVFNPIRTAVLNPIHNASNVQKEHNSCCNSAQEIFESDEMRQFPQVAMRLLAGRAQQRTHILKKKTFTEKCGTFLLNTVMVKVMSSHKDIMQRDGFVMVDRGRNAVANTRRIR